MSGGWQNDGRARPDWLGCPHQDTVNDRCAACNAKSVGPYIPGKRTAYVATPMGSFVVPNRSLLGGMSDQKGTIAKEQWNHGKRRAA